MAGQGEAQAATAVAAERVADTEVVGLEPVKGATMAMVAVARVEVAEGERVVAAMVVALLGAVVARVVEVATWAAAEEGVAASAEATVVLEAVEAREAERSRGKCRSIRSCTI